MNPILKYPGAIAWNTTAWKCPACGAVLTTQGGVSRHQARCRVTEDRLPGQVSMDEYAAAKEQGAQERRGMLGWEGMA